MILRNSKMKSLQIQCSLWPFDQARLLLCCPFFWWFLDRTKLRTYGVEQVFKWASFCQKNLVSLCGSIHWLLVLSCFVISSWVLFICHNYDDIIKVILFPFFFFGFKWKTKTKQIHRAMSSWDEWLSSCFVPLPWIKCYSNHNYFFCINS